MVELLLHDFLGFVEGHGRDGVDDRQLDIQQVKLGLYMLGQIVHQILEHAGFHRHDIIHRVNVCHFKVQTNVLVQMAGGVVTLCAVNIANLKHAAKHTGGVLLVELRRLRQISLLAEIVQLEDVCAALSTGRNDFRGVDAGEALAHHVFREALCNGCLNAEYSTLARMAQGNRAERQVNVQRQAHILLAKRYGELLCRASQNLDIGQDNLEAVLCTGFLADIARNLDDHRVLDVRLGQAADLAGQHALNQAAVDADDHERKVRHVAHAVHGAAESDRAADVGCAVLDCVNILLGGAYKFHGKKPLYQSEIFLPFTHLL